MTNNTQRAIILDELMDDGLDLEAIYGAVNNVLSPVNVVNPERVKPVRNTDYYESVIPHYTLDDFHNHFRMNRSTFQVLTPLDFFDT